MEEEKAAAYYDELTRKGEGAARFKQGLGFSSASKETKPTAATTSSSLFSNFVRAASPGKGAELDRKAQLEKIQNKLKKPLSPSPDRGRRSQRSRERDDDSHSSGRRRRSSSRERGRESDGRRSRHHRHRSRERDRDSYHRSRRRSRSRSRSRSPRRDSRTGDREDRARRERDSACDKHKGSRDKSGGSGVAVDYSQLIEGYSKMTPAERVKAKMKFQLSETAAKDRAIGVGSGWERFDFNKEAPLDDDNEVEVADDDASLVKDISKSFRFSAVEAKREEEIKAAHDEAMFGASAPSAILEVEQTEESGPEYGEKHIGDALVSEKVIAMQQGSWRDRARLFRNMEH